MRGHVDEAVGGQAARDHIDAPSLRYAGTDYRNPIGPAGRFILRIKPDKVNTSATGMARRQLRHA